LRGVSKDNPEEKQLVTKCKVKGMEGEFNLAINSPSKNALIDAFGTETKNGSVSY
jgi:hypothetical protein